LLAPEVLRQMRVPTVELQGGTLGDAVGICWFLRDVDRVRTVGHGGSANGQFAELQLVPDRNVAVVALSNAGPDGGLAFNRAVVEWVLERYAGVVDRNPQPLPFDEARAREVVGTYENEMMTIIIASDGAGLTIECKLKPEVRASTDTELPPDLPPAELGLLPGDTDGYLVTSGGLTGQRGHFSRDGAGEVVSIDLAGRVFTRARAASR